MIRAIIFRLWPILLLILVLWLVYALFFKKRKQNETLPAWQAKLWLFTFGATVLFLLASVVMMVLEFDENSDKKYVPAHLEDGKMVPAQMVDENGNPKQ